MKNELIGKTLLILMSGICTDILKPICQRRHQWAYSTNSKIQKTGFPFPNTIENTPTFVLGSNDDDGKLKKGKKIWGGATAKRGAGRLAQAHCGGNRISTRRRMKFTAFIR